MELNQGTVFVSRDVYQAQIMHLAQWPWEDVPEAKELENGLRSAQPLKNWTSSSSPIGWFGIPDPGDEVRERVEAVKRWFVNDWQMLDNKIKSSIVEGVAVFLAMFDMPDVAQVFCPGAPEIPDDPQAISVQARAKARAEGKAQEPGKKPGGGQTRVRADSAKG